jgi:hypothetical protein
VADYEEALAALLSRYGGVEYAPGATWLPAATTAYGTQEKPLDRFYGAGGAAGNKTTNKDLPEWLRKLGMKGDAYAGGMLKPQIRYGFWFKDGKIHFADGTSYAAKKEKAGGKTAYRYTDASGASQLYTPTDEQAQYNKNYKAATSNQSFWDKAGNTLGFELWHGKQLLKDFDVNNAFFGVDPIGVKFGNAVTGRDDKPLVDQFGGALESRYADYGKPTGYAKPLHDIAHVIASYYGGQGLNNLASAGVKSLQAGNAAGGSNLGIFADGGQAGLTGVGGGNVGALEASGAIAGGAGVAGGAASTVTGGGMPGATANSSWMDWVPSLISAGASIYGGRQANNATAAASDRSIASQERMFDIVRSDTAPQRALGAAAIGRLAALSGYNETGTPDFSSFYADPGRNFAISEGQQAIDRSLAAKGGALSGAGVKEGVRFATGMADQQYSAFIDRLLQQAGLGNTGIGASAAAGANAANNISATAMNAGNARASTYLNTAANVNNSLQSGYENVMLRRYLNG